MSPSNHTDALCDHYNSLLPTANIERRKILSQLVNLQGPCVVETGFNCVLGQNIKFYSGVYINHNVTIAALGPTVFFDNVFVGPNSYFNIASTGRLSIGESAWIGANVTIDVAPNQHLTIGAQSVVGAGSLVTESIADYHTAYGKPLAQYPHR